jgi:hypothetical protein
MYRSNIQLIEAMSHQYHMIAAESLTEQKSAFISCVVYTNKHTRANDSWHQSKYNRYHSRIPDLFVKLKSQTI